MGIGKILLELLNANNTNANELAKQIGVSANTLYSIIKRDNMKVDIEVLIKASDALGVPVEYFYDKRTKATGSFTEHEIKHIKKYRQLDADGKERVDYVLNMEHKMAQERKEDKND